ncbi:hypothetical protein LUZ60_012078 [Juncus effusus]|nr:hypothetical protein LUZ60_012078 [Juncus effusus]
MAKASSRNISSLTQRRKCPCGDDQCYILPKTSELKTINNSSQINPMQIIQSINITTCETYTPFVGQTFHTAEEGLELYTNFAKRNGFAIRTERSKGNPNHPLGVYKRELVCHRAGTYRPRKTLDPKRQRNKKSNRCNCEAGMVIKKNVLNGISKWVVVQFNNVHNHDLLDCNEVMNLPAYRNICSTDRERALNLANTGSTVNQIMRELETEKGVGLGHLTFTERDLRNFLQVSKTVNVENEGTELLNVCEEMKGRNEGFNFEFSVGEDGKLENICFVYGESVRGFRVFGDVVVFDTTYRLYWYDRMVGVWFGVDNYGNALCFGCVLLEEESTSSYCWALQSFVRLMDGKFPQTLLTDLDISLKEAISIQLPNTKHIFAPCYIKSKLSSWFSLSLGPSQFEKFTKEFQRVCNFDNLDEFTDQWGRMVSEFRLATDRHVNMLVYNRDYWALPFLRGWFLGGLIEESRDFEASITSFFKGFLESQIRLRDFVEQVGLAMDLQNQSSEESAMRQNYQNLSLKTCMPLEEHAKSALTPYSFNLFQKELVESTQFAVYETDPQTYLTRHHLRPAGGHVVQFVGSDEYLRCSCKEFESSGILCRHALRVLTLKNCFSVPDQYLLARWRRETAPFPKSTGCKYRSRALKSLVSIIIQESSVTKESFSHAQLRMSEILSDVREMPTQDEKTVDLIPVRPRGRPRKMKVGESNGTGEEMEMSGLDMRELCEKESGENEMQQDLWETHELFGTQDMNC